MQIFHLLDYRILVFQWLLQYAPYIHRRSVCVRNHAVDSLDIIALALPTRMKNSLHSQQIGEETKCIIHVQIVLSPEIYKVEDQ